MYRRGGRVASRYMCLHVAQFYARSRICAESPHSLRCCRPLPPLAAPRGRLFQNPRPGGGGGNFQPPRQTLLLVQCSRHANICAGHAQSCSPRDRPSAASVSVLCISEGSRLPAAVALAWPGVHDNVAQLHGSVCAVSIFSMRHGWLVTASLDTHSIRTAS